MKPWMIVCCGTLYACVGDPNALVSGVTSEDAALVGLPMDAASADVPADVTKAVDTADAGADAQPDAAADSGQPDIGVDVGPDVTPAVYVDPCVQMDCSDSNPCTDDNCLGGVCSHGTNTLPCDDGSPCTKDDVCTGGVCGAGTPCDDGNPCTLDVCFQGVCQYAAGPKPCTPPGSCITKPCELPGADPTVCALSACAEKTFIVNGAFSLCACDAQCEKYGDCCADYQALCQ